MKRFLRILSALGLLGLAGLAATPDFRISAVSARADKVSGGDVLLRIDAPDNDFTVKLNGAETTPSFRPAGDGTFVGLVTGLRIGANAVEVFRRRTTEAAARLEVVNHPITGPLFSGPHEQPFVCQTQEFVLPDGTSLGPPLDADCSVERRVTYVYKSTAAAFKPLPEIDALPGDVAFTTTSTGAKVPFVVRVETGTINRAIYQIAVLHNPASEADPSPFTPPRNWNRRLLYAFGGGCNGGWYKQGVSLGLASKTPGMAMISDGIVGLGYAVASSTLNVFGNNCQDITAAETMAMVKERFIEAYGPPLFTFARGGSGGAYQQIQIADNYPGLLDGIIPGATFPDVLETIQFLTDAQLLNRYFSAAGNELTPEQKRAIAGVAELQNITNTASSAGRINATGFCPAELPQALRYHPRTNPAGTRCDVFDHTVNVYGRDPETGFARRPVDNTGVQYGLAAFQAGVIGAAAFIDLNEKIGGYDNDGNMVSARSVADPQALRAAYQTGLVTNGGGGLASIPIIDIRNYTDRTANGDLHLEYHSFAFRERLLRANGATANEVMLIGGSGRAAVRESYAIAMMDEWLTSLANDKSSDRTIDKIVRARPAGLSDSCQSPEGERIIEQQTFNGGACGKLYPAFPSPRMVAGGPLSNDVLKCRLKPIDFGDYPVALTESEKARLKASFPFGVCDWSKPGVEQQKPTATWLAF